MGTLLPVYASRIPFVGGQPPGVHPDHAMSRYETTACTPFGLTDVHFWHRGFRRLGGVLGTVERRRKEENVDSSEGYLGDYPRV